MRDCSNPRAVLAARDVVVDHALLRGHTSDQGPIGFPGLSILKRLAKKRGCAARAGNDQHTGSLAVEPVNQSRFYPLSIAQRLKHPVDMPIDPSSALNGESSRLVEHKNLFVLVQHIGNQNIVVAPVPHGCRCLRHWPGFVSGLNGRHPHRLPGSQPR